MRVLERSGIAFGSLILVVLPTALHGWPTTLRGNLFTLVVLSAGLSLMWWRSHPRAASVLALGLLLLALAIGGGWFPDTAVAIYSVSFAVLALGWSGRAAWLVALCAAAYLRSEERRVGKEGRFRWAAAQLGDDDRHWRATHPH